MYNLYYRHSLKRFFLTYLITKSDEIDYEIKIVPFQFFPTSGVLNTAKSSSAELSL